MIKTTSRVALALGAAVTLSVGAAPCAQAQSDQKTVAVDKAPDAASGLVIAIDPATGKIRQPEPAEINALQQAPSTKKKGAEAAPPQQFALPGGGFGLMVDRSFDCAAVVSKTTEGKVKGDCVVGEDNATAIVNGQQTTKDKEHRDEK